MPTATVPLTTATSTESCKEPQGAIVFPFPDPQEGIGEGPAGHYVDLREMMPDNAAL